MAKFELKLKAIEMRKKGVSIREIATILNVSKNSASRWCSDIDLPPELIEKIISKGNEGRIKNSYGRLLGAKMNKQKKLDIISMHECDGIKTIGELGKRDIILISAALYWAEGSKKNSRFIFVNSDPEMINMMYIYLTKILMISKEEIQVTIQINHIHKYRIDTVINFWSNLLDIPTSQFSNPYYIKTISKKVYNNMDTYYGIARLIVKKGSQTQYHMLGLIHGIIQHIPTNMSG